MHEDDLESLPIDDNFVSLDVINTCLDENFFSSKVFLEDILNCDVDFFGSSTAFDNKFHWDENFLRSSVAKEADSETKFICDDDFLRSKLPATMSLKTVAMETCCESLPL
jgi:hypothetical protein